MEVPTYRKLIVDIDSKAGIPIKPPVTELLLGYRDPALFRYSALPRPTIDPCPPITFKMSKYFFRIIYY